MMVMKNNNKPMWKIINKSVLKQNTKNQKNQKRKAINYNPKNNKLPKLNRKNADKIRFKVEKL